MANELKKLIREAFNIAYENHKNKLSESVESLKATMSSSDVYKAENAFREIKDNPNMAAKYAWTPQGSANGVLNTKQFNLLSEMVFENTDSNTKHKIFMTMYSDKNPALVNTIKAKLMGMKGTFVTEDEAINALEIGWNEMFLGEKTKSGEILKKGFADAEREYVPMDGKNFGAYLMTRILSSSSNALRDYFSSEKTQSLDAPVARTGKPREIGGESGEDFGSDVIEDPAAYDALKDIGGAFDEPDTEEPESGISDEELSGEPGDEPSRETLGHELAGSTKDEMTPSEKEARKMIRILSLSLKQAISEFRSYDKVSEAQERGLKALEMILNTGASPQEASSALGYNATVAIDILKDNKNFVKMADDYLFTNGFLNARGKVESFVNIKPMYLSQMVKYMKSNDAKHLSPELKEGTFWFINDLIFETFVSDNLDKIMERVYNRLAPKLND